MNAVRKRMEDPNLTVYATISELYDTNPLLTDIFNKTFAFHYEITSRNREDICKALMRELKGSVQLVAFEKNWKGE